MNTLIIIFCCIPLIIFIIFAIIITYQLYKLKARAGKSMSEFLADFQRQVTQNTQSTGKPKTQATRKEEKVKPREFEDAEFRREEKQL